MESQRRQEKNYKFLSSVLLRGWLFDGTLEVLVMSCRLIIYIHVSSFLICFR